MKIICPILTAVSVLCLASCGGHRNVVPGTTGLPLLPTAAKQTGKTEEKPADNSAEKPEVTPKPGEAAPGNGNDGMPPWLIPDGSEQQKPVQPSAAQQAAAEQMLQNAGGQAASVPAPVVADPEPLNLAEPTSGSIPGRRSLRLGTIAPPEEAASGGADAPQPLPNSVERHGLRSPLLPKNLPMDINGKLTGNADN